MKTIQISDDPSGYETLDCSGTLFHRRDVVERWLREYAKKEVSRVNPTAAGIQGIIDFLTLCSKSSKEVSEKLTPGSSRERYAGMSDGYDHAIRELGTLLSASSETCLPELEAAALQPATSA
jgi:hypothetical protein